MHGLRERKKAATHDQIRDCAIGLFVERGYDSVTTDEIAAAATVSTRTLFRYFPSKEDLVFGEANDHIAAILAGLDQLDVSAHPLDALFDTLAAVAGDSVVGAQVSSRPGIVRESPALRGRALQIQRTLCDALIDRLAVATGRPRTDVDLHLSVTASIAAMATAAETWVPDGPSSFAVHLRAVLERLHSGLSL